MSIDFVGTSALDMLRATLATRLPHGEKLSFARIAREYLQIRTMDNRVVPFYLRRLQKRYLARKRLARQRGKPPKFLLLKYRRGGYTTLEQGLSYYTASRRRNVTVMTLAQDTKTTQKIFRIAQLMHERDPKAPPIKGPGNQYKLEFPGLNSSFYIDTAGARSVARGDTLSRVHWSEVAWSCLGFNQSEKQQMLLAGISEAASMGEVVLETTPNGFEYFRELYVTAKAGKNDWTPIFLPWYDDPHNSDAITSQDERQSLLSNLDEDEQRLVRLRGLSAAQIKWRRRKKHDLKHLFPQEYPEDDDTCWLVSGTPYFDPKLVMRLRDDFRGPALVDDLRLGSIPVGARHLPGGYEIEYEAPVRDAAYCIGVDTSEGLPGCDPNGLGVMRRDNGAMVAACHGLFNPRVLADHVVRLARKYNDALVGIERENHGHAVIQKVIDLGYDAPHHRGGSLYYKSLTKERHTSDRPVERAGWSTNAITRPLMLDGIRDWLETEGVEDRCLDRVFLDECMTFRLQADGRFDHDSGCHDDSIMKWAIANQMRTVDWRRSTFEELEVNRWSR